MNKTAQMKLSFGMIFSIFLIIIFLAFAIYAIIKFINLQHTIQIKIFKNDLQDDVKAIWLSSQEESREVEYYLPNKISAVCFTDEVENLYFESKKIILGDKIEHIDIEEITSGGDYCIENIEGKVSMTLVKDYGETLVKITR